jgi:hypothetical protein
MSDDELFDGKQVLDWAKGKLRAQRLPLPKKPAADKPEYEFPEDPDALTSVELGQLMLKYAAYHGYTLRLMGVLDAELTALESEYQLKVQTYGLEARQELGRVAFDAIEAAVLQKRRELVGVKKRITELRTVRASLEASSQIYERHWNALSREQARRTSDIRTGG